MRNFFNKLMIKWETTGWGALAILLAFALAGMSVLRLSRPLLAAILPPDPPRWLWWTCRILIIVPIYEVLLLTYGTILGQRRFFWKKQKRLLLLILRRQPAK